MMYRTIDDFLVDWQNEEQITRKIFSLIPMNKAKETMDNVRSLEKTAWHITQTLTELLFRAGILEIDALENESIPENVKEIYSIYERNSKQLMNFVVEKWTDSHMLEKIDVYGQKWERRNILALLVKHQIHHRGQMTILLKLFGKQVPEVYGPTNEEWAYFSLSSKK